MPASQAWSNSRSVPKISNNKNTRRYTQTQKAKVRHLRNRRRKVSKNNVNRHQVVGTIPIAAMKISSVRYSPY